MREKSVIYHYAFGVHKYIFRYMVYVISIDLSIMYISKNLRPIMSFNILREQLQKKSR